MCDRAAKMLVLGYIDYIKRRAQAEDYISGGAAGVDAIEACLKTAFKMPEESDAEPRVNVIKYICLAKKRKEEAVEANCKARRSGHAKTHTTLGTYAMRGKDYSLAISEFTLSHQLCPDDPHILYLRADAFFKANNYLRAVQDCLAATKMNPRYSKAFERLGDVYAKLNEWDEAVKAYDKANAIDPTDNILRIHLQLARQQARAQSAQKSPIPWRRKQFSDPLAQTRLIPTMATLRKVKAKVHESQGVSVYPEQPRKILLRKSHSEEDLKQQREEERRKTIQQRQDKAEEHKRQGKAAFDEGKFNEARMEYTLSLELCPEDATAFFLRANTFVRLRHYLQAIEDCQQAIQLNNKYAKAYGLLGNLHAELRHWAEALEAYENAVRFDPTDDMNRLNVRFARQKLYKSKSGSPRSNKSDGDDKMKHLPIVPEIFTEDQETAKRGLKKLAKKVNNPEEEEESAEKTEIEENLTQQQQEEGEAHRELGLTAIKDKNFELAMTELTSAIEIYPRDHYAFYLRANVFIKMDQRLKAVEDAKKAIRLDPKNAKYYNLLGDLYTKLNNFKGATEAYDISHKCDPTQPAFPLLLPRLTTKKAPKGGPAPSAYFMEYRKQLNQSLRARSPIDSDRSRGRRSRPMTLPRQWRPEQEDLQSASTLRGLDVDSCSHGDTLSVENLRQLLEGQTLVPPSSHHLYGEASNRDFRQRQIVQHATADAAFYPQTEEGFYQRATDLMKINNHQEAIENCKQAILCNPRSARSYGLLGDLYSELHDWQEAIDAYDRAVKFDPTDHMFKLNKRYCQRKLDESGASSSSSSKTLVPEPSDQTIRPQGMQRSPQQSLGAISKSSGESADSIKKRDKKKKE